MIDWFQMMFSNWFDLTPACCMWEKRPGTIAELRLDIRCLLIRCCFCNCCYVWVYFVIWCLTDYNLFVQEEIHQLLLSFAEVGANVVRLKGGDPLVCSLVLVLDDLFQYVRSV